MKDLAKLLGEKIKEARISNGFTQEKLAKQITIDKSYIGHLENGLKTPSLKLLGKMAEVFNVPYRYFFDDALSPKAFYKVSPKVKRIFDKIKNKDDKKLEVILGILSLVDRY